MALDSLEPGNEVQPHGHGLHLASFRSLPQVPHAAQALKAASVLAMPSEMEGVEAVGLLWGIPKGIQLI